MNPKRVIGLILMIVVVDLGMVVPNAFGEESLGKFFADTLHLTFVREPTHTPEVFGVGAIVQGRGNSFYTDCLTDVCFPAKSTLIQTGIIKISRFPQNRVTRKKADTLFLKFLKLDYKGNDSKSAEIEFEDAVQEEIDLETAALICDKYLLLDGPRHLLDQKKPRRELVIKAVRCKALNIKFYDQKGHEVALPTTLPLAAGFTRNDDYTVSMKDVWFGIRTVIFSRTSPPASSGDPPPTPVVTRPVVQPDPSNAVHQKSQEQYFAPKETQPRKGFFVMSSR